MKIASEAVDPTKSVADDPVLIQWVEAVFTTKRSEMKGIDWGLLYNKFNDVLYDTAKLEGEVKALVIDDELPKMKGVYTYVLTRDEKYFSLRQFTEGPRPAAAEPSLPSHGPVFAGKSGHHLSGPLHVGVHLLHVVGPL